MKPKTMILMVVAIVCGLGASYMTSRLLAERNNETPEKPKVNVLVAKKLLDNGTSLKKPGDLFEDKEYTQGEEPKEALVSFDQLKGKFLNRNLRKGDFITAKDLVDSPTSLPIPEGMKAQGIRVTSEGSAGGWGSAIGSKVDIIWTIRGTNTMDAQSGTLLENVLVLAADNTKDKKDDGGSTYVAQVVTVALTSEDVLKVNLAKDVGTLSLSLRGTEEEGSNKTFKSASKVTLSGMLKDLGVKTMDLNPAPPTPVESPAPVVEKPKDSQPVVDTKTNKKKHVVVINDGTGKSKTQVFWVDAKGNLLLEGFQPSEDSETHKTPAHVENNPPVQSPALNPANNGTPPSGTPAQKNDGAKENATNNGNR